MPNIDGSNVIKKSIKRKMKKMKTSKYDVNAFGNFRLVQLT